MLDYLVVYESETGNTKKIATEIFAALPGMSKDLINLQERESLPEAKVYFVGFCVHRGTCSIELGRFLGGLSDKSVALFGTCGAGNSEEYYKHIESSVQIWLEDDNQYLGAFLCQGKMPQAVRHKYEERLKSCEGEEAERIRQSIQNFDMAMVHPDAEDIEKAKAFTLAALEKLR